MCGFARAQQTPAAARPAPNPLRNAYFGDLHVHTSYSLDAYTTGNRNDPRVAYRFGRGDTVTLPGGSRNHLKVPLDFMAVTDHDLWLGEISLCQDPTDPAYNTAACRELRFSDQDVKPLLESVFMKMLPGYFESSPSKHNPEICGEADSAEKNKCFQRAKSIWAQIQKNADEFYQPGKFTTFSGFEWTAGFKRLGMLHRNVIFRGGHLPETVLSAVELNNTPERLWQWLEKDCSGDCQVMSIPHNTNFGFGIALGSKNSDGSPFETEGLKRRAKTEPIIEIHQNKGNSECAPGLGTDDEQCNFEQLFKACKPGEDSRCAFASDYVRNALKTGLLLDQQYGVNPFKYGFIGSTDTHSATPGSTESDNWNGHFGLTDGTPDARLQVTKSGEPLPSTLSLSLTGINPGGLAAVWAEENTRESIFDALKRKESFATSGTRIRVRFFGGWNYAPDLDRQRDLLQQAYENGVPMGGDLRSKPDGAAVPRFVAWATKDPNSANLRKIQIIKGWTESGQTHEKVYDVACSNGLKPDGTAHRCPDNHAKVDVNKCSTNNKGDAELSTTWTDPDFKPAERAFYYVRVLENPTCRWSTYDAHRLGLKPRADLPATVEQRAWSSPIWYTPSL